MASRASAKGVLPVLKTADANFEAAFEKIVNRRDQEAENVEKTVRRIMERVRSGGDDELVACVLDGDTLEVWGVLTGSAQLDGVGGSVSLDGVRFALLPATMGPWELRAESDVVALRAFLPPAGMGRRRDLEDGTVP